jgi:N-methylhydantoinase A/oxoprolinase/acetone carboxylase beta subunit
VLFDQKQGVIKSAKAPTTRHRLSIGIEAAVRSVLSVPPSEIELVSLSSTLATNSIVEGKGNPVCLLLIGYDPRLVEETPFDRLVPDEHIAFIPGGHTYAGDEQYPLDAAAAEKAIVANAHRVSAFAVSGYFSVRNPDHELRVKEMVRRLTKLPVTCGHELTSQLDAPRRAVTTALNARLISLIHSQVMELKQFLAALGVNAPLMVVKGDGSLIDAEMALERPVETILSGPAASVVGALYLGKKKTAIVVDIGGTTTDVAVVRDGLPSLNSQGATVGGWQTMVEALDVHTAGLGGDSEVRLDKDDTLVVGPRRVIPLSMLAADHPSVLEALKVDLQSQPDPRTDVWWCGSASCLMVESSREASARYGRGWKVARYRSTASWKARNHPFRRCMQ